MTIVHVNVIIIMTRTKEYVYKSVDTFCVPVRRPKDMITVHQCGEIVGNINIERKITRLSIHIQCKAGGTAHLVY